MSATTLLTLAVALLFAAVHVFSARLAVLDSVPRSRWLSFGGGVSVAYVFLHVLPELAEHQAGLDEEARVLRAEAEVFLVALVGLAGFYGLESLARRAGRGTRESEGSRVFWIHIGVFALYNALIGFLLVHRQAQTLRELGLYTVALGLHFIVNDRGLSAHHGDLYARAGRWIVAAAVLAGWGAGVAVEGGEALVAGLFALLAGGIILNVLKEELPEDRESRFGAFVAGAALYGAILVML